MNLQKLISTLTPIVNKDSILGIENTYKETSLVNNVVFKNQKFDRLNLSKFDFSNSTFYNVFFQNCNFNFVTMENTEFNDCLFNNCTFNYSFINNLKAKDTNFKDCSFFYATTKWLFLSNCDLINISFKNGLLTSTDFRETNFIGVTILDEMEISGVSFPNDFNY